eukprot:UN18073
MFTRYGSSQVRSFIIVYFPAISCYC